MGTRVLIDVENDDEETCATSAAKKTSVPATVPRDGVAWLPIGLAMAAVLLTLFFNQARCLFCMIPGPVGVVVMCVTGLKARAKCERIDSLWPLLPWAAATYLIMGLWGAGYLDVLSVCE